MPTYDYKCNECGNIFEKFHSIAENHEFHCENCGAKNTQKMIGAGAGILFKGSGFYVTDYKNKKPVEKPKAEKPAEAPKKTEANK